MYAIPFYSSELMMSKERLSFGEIVDKVFWGLLVLIAMWAGNQLQDLSKSVQTLNTTMATLGVKVEAAQTQLVKTIEDNEKQNERLREIEYHLGIKSRRGN